VSPPGATGSGYRTRRRGRGWQGGDVRHARRHSCITYQPHRAVSVEIPGRKGNGARSPPEALAIRPSVISGNRTQMRRRPFRKIEHHFIDVTPAPPFRRIIGLDDRVSGRVKMFCCVPVWRLIAATDMATSAADPQMQPGVTRFQAFLTPRRARNNVADSHDMFARYCHVSCRFLCDPACPA
jgi:hypothetical protein